MASTFIKPAGLLRRIFNDRDKRKQANKRLNRLMKDKQVSNTIAEAILAAKIVTQAVRTVSAANQAV